MAFATTTQYACHILSFNHFVVSRSRSLSLARRSLSDSAAVGDNFAKTNFIVGETGASE
jgi:hypothetical protein